jgi:predicted acetyltransferase
MVSLTTDDAERIREIEDTVWFSVAPGLTAQDYIESLDMGRTRAVEVEGPPPVGTPADRAAPLAGIYSAWLMGVTVPGPAGNLGRQPMSGLTWVGVHPDRRRRGILRQMMTDHLHGVHDAGETPIAGLHASEPGIYGRFGYGGASSDVELSMGRGVELRAGDALDASAAEVSTHFVSVDSHEASRVLHDIHLAAAEHTLGSVTRGDDVAATWFRDHPTARGEKEPRRVMFAQRADTVTGYALFRRISKWGDDNQPSGEVLVPEIGAVDSGSLLALGRRMLDFDLTSTVKLYSRSIDDPLLWWAGGPRAVGVRTSDGLWIRLVDVDKALTARGYSAPVDVVLDVTDELCPWNARRWRLTADADGAGRCVPTDDDAEVRLPVQALGAAYLGGRSIAAQAAAGQVTELREGAVRELSRAMRADTEPFGAIGF